MLGEEKREHKKFTNNPIGFEQLHHWLVKSDALALIRQAGDQCIGQEGAVGTYLLSEDSCDPPLMFGEGCILKLENYNLATRGGFGLQIHLKKFAQGLDKL